MRVVKVRVGVGWMEVGGGERSMTRGRVGVGDGR